MGPRNAAPGGPQRPMGALRDRMGLALVLVGFLLVAVIGAGGLVYLRTLRTALWDQTVSDVLEVTSQNARTFEVYLDRDKRALTAVGQVLESCESTDVVGIHQRLEVFDSFSSACGVVDFSTGMLYAGSGSDSVKLDDQSLAVYRGLSDEGIREPFLSDFSGKEMLGYYRRIHFADGAKGLVYEGTPIDDVSSKFALSLFDGQGFSYVVNSRGRVIVQPGDEGAPRFESLFEVLDDGGADESVLADLRAGIASDERGALHLKVNGVDSVVAYVPVMGTSNWDIVAVVPDSVIGKRADELMNVSALFAAGLAVMVAVFFAYVVVVVLLRRRMRHQEAETAYRERLFGLLSDNADDIYVLLSPDDRTVEYVTPNVERVLGVPVDLVRGRINAIEPVEGERGLSFASLKPGEPVSYSGPRRHRVTGEERWYVDTFYRVEVNGKPRVILAIQDRTDERHKQEVLRGALKTAEMANDAKSTFLSNMSHDIRTPMNAIVGLATLLSRDADKPDAVRDHTAKIKASSRLLLSLINDVLDMSKIESGNTTLNMGEVDLAEVVQDVVTVVRPQAKARRQDFSVQVEGLGPCLVLGDRVRLSQVLVNLLSNAVKYTPEGGSVALCAEERPVSRSGFVAVRFRVADTGIGMAPEFLAHVFEPFAREVNSTTNSVQGTGLGLAIAKSIVDLMGGSIDVASEPGKGSVFTLDLEFKRAARVEKGPEAAGPVAEGQPRESASIQGLHFLAAEDNALSANILEELLDMEGATVQLAENGRRAVELFETAAPGTFDAILMDVQMPVMNGLEAARAIRSSGYPGAEDVPIVALTANAFVEDVRRVLDAGMDAHMAKPIEIEELPSVYARARAAREKARKG